MLIYLLLLLSSYSHAEKIPTKALGMHGIDLGMSVGNEEDFLSAVKRAKKSINDNSGENTGRLETYEINAPDQKMTEISFGQREYISLKIISSPRIGSFIYEISYTSPDLPKAGNGIEKVLSEWQGELGAPDLIDDPKLYWRYRKDNNSREDFVTIKTNCPIPGETYSPFNGGNKANCNNGVDLVFMESSGVGYNFFRYRVTLTDYKIINRFNAEIEDNSRYFNGAEPEELKNKKTASIPFYGRRVFNFYDGSGTAQTISISDDGMVVIESHGTNGSVVDFSGEYGETMHGDHFSYRIKDGEILLISDDDVVLGCTGEKIPCKSDLYMID